MSSRAQAIRDGRTFVEVRASAAGGDHQGGEDADRLATVGVCPGCWNSRAVRPMLLARLSARGLVVVHGEDGATGAYRGGAVHAPRCPRSIARR